MTLALKERNSKTHAFAQTPTRPEEDGVKRLPTLHSGRLPRRFPSALQGLPESRQQSKQLKRNNRY
jgi:hypothetical protein